MPIIEAHIVEGYDDATKTRLCRALTDAVRSVLPAPPDAITVMIGERPRHHYMRGGHHRDGAPPRPDPIVLIRSYLDAMEARDLPAAQMHLTPDFAMVFPGGVRMSALSDLVSWASTRYRQVRKSYEGWDCGWTGDVALVHVRGTLAGEWLDGRSFDSIRFIDRFEVRDGLIARQDVWNDLGEVRSAS